MSEKLLLEKIEEGDAEAFEKLFRKYYDPLLHLVWGYVKSEAIAGELVQELFTKIWERDLPAIQVSVKTYLYRSARNMSIDYLRHQKVVNGWEEEKRMAHVNQPFSAEPDKKLHEQMLLEEIEKAIQSLPERRRLVFILNRYNHMTYEEIAEYLNISVNTVETQISRALSTLRKRFSHLLTVAVALSWFLS